jgi:hypothetical protein
MMSNLKSNYDVDCYGSSAYQHSSDYDVIGDGFAIVVLGFTDLPANSDYYSAPSF